MERQLSVDLASAGKVANPPSLLLLGQVARNTRRRGRTGMPNSQAVVRTHPGPVGRCVGLMAERPSLAFCLEFR